MNKELIDELYEALLEALPFVEDALCDPVFKRGSVAKTSKQVRAAIQAAEDVLI